VAVVAEEASLTPDQPLAEWGRVALRERVAALVRAIPGARDAADSEGLRRLRVATRRLDTAMRIYEPCFAGAAFVRLSREARRARRRCGAVRDLEVLIEYLEAERVALQGIERLAMRCWLAQVHGERADRRRELETTLDWLEGRDLERQAEVVVANGGDRASLPLSFRQAAPPQLLERYRDLITYVEYVDQPDAETELHAMRISVKRLRYAMEIFAPSYVDALKGELQTARRLQKHLGDLHDSDVRRERLAALHQQPPGKKAMRRAAPATATDLQQGLPLLLAREEARRAEIYQEFRGYWHELERGSFPESLHVRLQNPNDA